MGNCQKHKKDIEKYDGNLSELAIDIGDLHYESLRDFLKELSKKINKDSHKDHEAGRTQLAESLKELSMDLLGASYVADDVWDICEPYMKEK